MLNELLLALARWLADQTWSIGLHESIYMYSWIETTHVLTLTVFLGMLIIVDLRMLGVLFVDIPATKIAKQLDLPMMIGVSIMLLTGLLLYYSIPVRTTQSIWFRIKIVLLIVAAINALWFRARMQASGNTWNLDRKPPGHVRFSAGLSLLLWGGVVLCGRAIAYDWFDCSKQMSVRMYWLAGCVDEMAIEMAGGH